MSPKSTVDLFFLVGIDQNNQLQAVEQRIAALVNQAYGLSAEEVELMWKTAPPRMPIGN